MTSVLITGTSRGIGLDLVRRFLDHADPPKLLIATCRNPDAATKLQELKAKNPNLQILKLDVDDIDGYPAVVEKVATLVGDAGLNVLINNAAIKPETPHPDITWQIYQKVIHTNTIAPIFLTKALLPLIKNAAASSKRPAGIGKAAILNVTSLLGSVSLNNGGYHAYRESKAALNQSARILAAEVGSEGIIVVNLHPGWVRTDMGGSEAPLSVDDSTSGLIEVIYNLKQEDHDTFVTHKGEKLPW